MLRGCERVSSEYFVKVAKAGIRRSTLTFACCVMFLVAPRCHVLTFLLFFSCLQKPTSKIKDWL